MRAASGAISTSMCSPTLICTISAASGVQAAIRLHDKAGAPRLRRGRKVGGRSVRRRTLRGLLRRCLAVLDLQGLFLERHRGCRARPRPGSLRRAPLCCALAASGPGFDLGPPQWRVRGNLEAWNDHALSGLSEGAARIACRRRAHVIVCLRPKNALADTPAGTPGNHARSASMLCADG